MMLISVSKAEQLIHEALSAAIKGSASLIFMGIIPKLKIKPADFLIL
jgi:hypothetical protein